MPFDFRQSRWAKNFFFLGLRPHDAGVSDSGQGRKELIAVARRPAVAKDWSKRG